MGETEEPPLACSSWDTAAGADGANDADLGMLLVLENDVVCVESSVKVRGFPFATNSTRLFNSTFCQGPTLVCMQKMFAGAPIPDSAVTKRAILIGDDTRPRISV